MEVIMIKTEMYDENDEKPVQRRKNKVVRATYFSDVENIFVHWRL